MFCSSCGHENRPGRKLCQPRGSHHSLDPQGRPRHLPHPDWRSPKALLEELWRTAEHMEAPRSGVRFAHHEGSQSPGAADEKAIALDPRYADAYTALGWSYYLEWDFRWSADPQTLERALTMAQRAIALDDSLAYAHALLGMVYAQKQQYDQAMVESERSTALEDLEHRATGPYSRRELRKNHERSESRTAGCRRLGCAPGGSMCLSAVQRAVRSPLTTLWLGHGDSTGTTRV
jgi:hypothetical protein